VRAQTDGSLRTALALACRLVLILGGLIATVGLLAACGSSSHPPATDATGAHTPSATSPKAAGAPSRAQAFAFAHAVNLTAADVPGFKPSAERESKPETTAEKQLARKLLHCIGGQTSSSPAELASANSADFKLDHDVIHLSVKSEVSVAQTAALANKELGVIHNNHVKVCLSHYFDLLLKNRILKEQRSRSSISPNSISTFISQGTPPAPGATGSYWWRIRATITVHKIKLPFYIDILGFTYGPAKVSLFSSGALRPFPAAAQEHLYQLLLQRAEAHSL
jgi:hypothetical protein